MRTNENLEKKKKIILNWLPPAKTFLPSPAMTVLKTTLTHAGFECDVIYWNIILNDIMSEYLFGLKPDNIDEINVLNIFYASIVADCEDEEQFIKQEACLRAIKPQYINSFSFDYKGHIRNCVKKMKSIVRNKLIELQLDQCLFFGMSMHLFQWVPASVIGKIAKEIEPSLFIAIGGIGNPKLANAYLSSFPFYDLSMWGEGEQAIVALANNLYSESDRLINGKNDIPQCYHRDIDGNIRKSEVLKKNYTELNEFPQNDFSDFFAQFTTNKNTICLFIEGSRGCHWNRCKFCFLNQGYKYRVKSPECIIKEIRQLINKYNVYSYSFLDNDVIGHDLNQFDHLLDGLIEIKKDYPEFKIELAEIISNRINKHLIRKMHLAGFVHVQVGYESPSDALLTKIDKKNTFASNLLFIKWAYEYRIHIGGMNVLRGLLDETNEDILEGMKNIHSLRFYKRSKYYTHNISSLAICDISKYYKELSKADFESNAYTDSVKEMLPNNYVRPEFQHTIYHYVRKFQSQMWGYFTSVDNYYRSNDFTYEICQQDMKTLVYTEYCNNVIINKIEFSKDELAWKILEFSNNEVKGLNELYTEFDMNKTIIDDEISNLYNSGLLYYSMTNKECVSLINTFNIL